MIGEITKGGYLYIVEIDKNGKEFGVSFKMDINLGAKREYAFQLLQELKRDFYGT